MKTQIFLSILCSLISLSVCAQFPTVAFWKQRKPYLKITTGAQTVSALNCSSVVTVQALTASGSANNLASPLTVNLSAAGMTFYSDANCATPITSVTIAAGSTTASFYFTVDSAGSPVLTASAASYTDGSQTETTTTNSYIWTGGGANSLWTTGANWSGGAAPGAGIQAIFNGTCVSNCSPTLNANLSIGGVRMLSGYTGTITQSSTYTITVGAFGWYQEAGTFVGGSNTMTFSNGNFTIAGGAFTSSSSSNVMSYSNFSVVGGTMTVAGPYTFVNAGTINSGNTQFQNVNFTPGNGVTINITGTMYVAGNLSLSQATNNVALNGGTVDLKGNLTIVNYGFPGTATIKLTGTGTQNIDGSAATAAKNLPNLTIASSGPVNLSGNLYLIGNYTYTSSGAFNAGTSVLAFVSTGNNETADMGSVSYYDLVYNASRDLTITADVTVSHKLTLGCAGACNGALLSTGKIKLLGDLVFTTGVIGTATISLCGSSNQLVTVSASYYTPPIEINSTGGTITFPASFTFYRDFTYLQGTIAGLGTAVFGGVTAVTITPGSYMFSNVTMAGLNSYNPTINGTMNVGGNLSFSASGNAVLAAGTFNLYGNYSYTSYYSMSVTTNFVGSGNQTITGASNCDPTTTYGVNKSGGSLKLMNNFNCYLGVFSQTSGNFDMNGFALNWRVISTLNGNTLTKNGGVLKVNGVTIGTGSLYGGTIAP
jgi:hypothetical protein